MEFEKIDKNNYKKYKQYFTVNKTEILKKIEEHIKNDYDGILKDKPSYVINEYKRLLEEFYKKIVIAEIYELQNDKKFWSYQIVISEQAITLYLFQVEGFKKNESNTFSHIYDAVINTESIYNIIQIDCDYFTVEEMAEIYNKSKGTIRQYIRRGAIRSVKKINAANESSWLIPKICEVVKNPYKKQEHTYHIKGKLYYADTRFNDILYNAIYISISHDFSGMYNVRTYKKDYKLLHEEKLDTNAKETLELYLLTQHNVCACDRYDLIDGITITKL